MAPDPKHEERPAHMPSLLASLPGPYQPQHVLTYNDNSVRVAKLDGAFVWHSHPETDELFYIVSVGNETVSTVESDPSTRPTFQLEIANSATNDERDGYGVVNMRAGDMYLVERGRRHRPNAKVETRVIVFDRSGTTNTGDAADTEEGRARTVVVDESRGA